MNSSIISWTTKTWNPTHGCSAISEGCRHCYAERLSLNKGFTSLPWTAANAPTNVTLKRHKLAEPTRLKDPSRIFVDSMSDLFHEQIPDDYLREVFGIMSACPQHTFQILTKRPARAAAWPGPWPPNVWMGTSIENAHCLSRLSVLRDCPAAVRFVSFEPLLQDVGTLDLTGYSWAIVGGESGPKFRPMPHYLARDIRDVCLDRGVAFFFKQSAAYRTEVGTSLHHGNGKFWSWQQFPGDLADPTPAPAHRYTYEDAATVAA